MLERISFSLIFVSGLRDQKILERVIFSKNSVLEMFRHPKEPARRAILCKFCP